MLCAFVALAALTAFASTEPGVTWDEPAYVAAGHDHWTWFAGLSAEPFSREAIHEHWAVNHEHPPAAKLLYGALGSFDQEHPLVAILDARLGAAALFVILVALVCGWTAAHFGRGAGALAALALVLIPRMFGHGLLAALDAPVALACFATTVAFSRADASWRRALLAGALWGLALLTKVNAVFLPIVLIPWAAWAWRRRALSPCLTLLFVGSVVFFVGWPWLWHDLPGRLGEYMVNKVERLELSDRPAATSRVPVHYLGRTYRDESAPWHYPFVMTLVTVPAGLLVLAGCGVRRAVAAGKRKFGLLVLAGAALHLGVAALPPVPKYDGVRLFLPAFPFLACLAGIGAARLWAWRRAGRVVVVAILLVAAAQLAYTHPYELSYYNALVGGAWGAERLGFETTYWGDTVNRRVMARVNALCPDGSSVAVLPPYQAFLDPLPWMRGGLRWAKGWRPGQPLPDFLLVFPRQGYLDDAAGSFLAKRQPVEQWTYLGVPQCMLFDLRADARKAGSAVR